MASGCWPRGATVYLAGCGRDGLFSRQVGRGDKSNIREMITHKTAFDVRGGRKRAPHRTTMSFEEAFERCVARRFDDVDDINTVDSHGFSLLQKLATWKDNRLDIMERMIDKGADVNARSSKCHLTVLGMYCRAGQLKEAELLVRRGAEINPKDAIQPLSMACVGGEKAVVRFLLEKGAAIDAVDVKGMTAVGWVSKTSHTDVLEMVLRGGADPHLGMMPPFFLRYATIASTT